jgi:hypothetical protein
MAAGQVGEYPFGSLVHVRERVWVVLPSEDDQVICLRPLSGSTFGRFIDEDPVECVWRHSSLWVRL